MLIISIRNGGINLMDIVRQLAANPDYVETFLGWVYDDQNKPGVGIVRALMGWNENHVVHDRDVKQLIDAIYVLAFIKKYFRVTIRLPKSQKQRDFRGYIQKFGKKLNDNMLQIASMFGNLCLVKYLSTLPGMKTKIIDNSAIKLASQYGHLDVVKFLSTLPDVGASGDYSAAVYRASQYGHLDIVQFLLTLREVDVSVLNRAMQRASSNGYLDVVEFLSTLPGVDASVDDNRAVYMATFCGNLDIVQFLLTLPEVKINRVQAEKMWTLNPSYNMKLFWKLYIDRLDRRKKAKQRIKRRTKLNK